MVLAGVGLDKRVANFSGYLTEHCLDDGHYVGRRRIGYCWRKQRTRVIRFIRNSINHAHHLLFILVKF